MTTHKHSSKNSTHSVDLANNENPCFCELNHFSWIGITGDNAASFLQGQLSCDVSTVDNDQACFGAYCDPKGRVIANFILLKKENLYYLWLPEDMNEILVTQLSKYAPFSRAKVQTILPPWIAIGTSQPIVLPRKLNETAVVFSITDATSPSILMLPTEYYDTLQQHLTDLHYQPAELKLWQRWLIQSKLAFIHPPTSTKFLPQMLSLDSLGAVSFTKGCYVGQEVIARTQHLGQLKRHLHYLTITSDKPLNCGDPLMLDSGDQAGIIIEQLQDPPQHYHVLAVIQDRHLDALQEQLQHSQ